MQSLRTITTAIAVVLCSSILAQSLHEVRVFAHRGGRYEQDENTLQAFKNSYAKGYSGFETDVRMTKDGVLVISHDSKLDRTNTTSGVIEEMTAAELRKVVSKKGNPLLFLDDFLDFLKDKPNLYVEFEMKTTEHDLYPDERMKEYADKARVIVYYSGHGVPNLETQEAYLLAVDGSPLTMSGSILIDNFYESLSATGVQSINVFLDCCFSGASKSGNMLVEARGTVIKPKASVPRENMVVMTACTGDQIAFPYTDQRHGMFTYFLLKKLKESKGEVQLGELFQYVQSNVRRQSLHDKKRKQEPSVEYDMSLMGTWGVLKLK